MQVEKLPVGVRIGYQPLWWRLKSANTNTLADGLTDKISSLLHEIESKTEHKDEEGNQ